MVSEEEMVKKIRLISIFVLMSLNMSAQAEELIEIEVYRSPSCGCCGKWLEHLKTNQFIVKDIVTNDVQAIKDKHGVSAAVSSCHTALVNGYVVEGHVPAVDIKKLLKIKSEITGISVPGMPVGTPGMEMGDKKDAYNVVSFDKDNNYQVFSRHKGD